MKSKLFLLLFITLTLNGCDKDDEIVEIETEQIVNGRIVFSANNQVPGNLKVMSLDGIREIDSNTNLNLPSSANELEFLLTDNNQIVFIRKSYPDIVDINLSSESTILFLTTYNTKYYNLSNENRATIVNQIFEHPGFTNAKNVLDNSTVIDITSQEFKEEILFIINEIFSEENLSALSTDSSPNAPLVDINYSNNSNTVTISNNTSNHIGYSVKKEEIQIGFDLIDGNESLNFYLNTENASYDFKMMSGADLSGVFSNNQLEEIEAFNADFNDFLFEAISIIIELAMPELNDSCMEAIFSSLIGGTNFAAEYGNNNDANDAFIEAFTDLSSLLPSVINSGFDCIQFDSGILGEILGVLNYINDIISISSFLIDTVQSITEYYAYENLSEKCFFYNGDEVIDCDNVIVSPVFNPNPINDATDVSLVGQLSFIPGANTPINSNYKIYFGNTTNLTDFEITNSPNNTYSGTDEDSIYYWKVETINDDNTVLATSPIWSFTTTATSTPVPTLTTKPITNSTETSASSGGNITNDGGSNVTARGICWSTNPNPTTDNNNTSDGTGIGNFTSLMSNLEANTTYYVKAYATNSEGTAYGNQRTFTTTNNNSIPTLTTKPITNSTETSALTGGNITNDGGSDVTTRGVCWSTNPNSTTDNNSTSDGTGTGNFISMMSSLEANTTYYVKAFATNSEGTAYGNQRTFTTNSTSGNSDIVVEEIWFDEESDGSWEIKTRVKNIGTEATPNGEDITIQYFVNGTLIGDDVQNPLDVNQDGTEKLDNFSFTQSGINQVAVIVLQVSNEIETINNVLTTNFDNSTSGNSDIIVEEIWFDEESDGSWEINTRVKNIGTEATPNGEYITIQYFVNGTLVGDDEQNPLDVNQDGTERLDNFSFTQSGINQVAVIVLQVSNEIETINNVLTTTFNNSSGGNPIAITPTNNCSSAPIMEVDTEYIVNIDVGDYSTGSPIDGESSGGNNIRGFWLSFEVPSNWSANHDVKIYDVSSNFNPVVGLRANCSGPFLGQGSSFDLFVNDTGNGGNETSDTNIPGSNNGGTPNDIYHVRIYHYNGSQTPNISFKIIIE